jgi:SWIM zinc finger
LRSKNSLAKQYTRTELHFLFSDSTFTAYYVTQFFVMGYLTNELSDGVGPLTKQRGRSYFLGGAVRLTEADGSHVSATVQGSQKYEVEIFVATTFLDASCTCPFYQRDFETCKHIWATALAAEQRGYLKDAVDFDRAEIFEAAAELIPQRTRQGPATTKNPAPPSWQQQLQPVLSAMKAEENRSGFANRPERELVYLIDLHDTLAYERLTVHIAQHDRKLNGDWGKLKTKKLGTYEVNNLPDPADTRILAILAGASQGMVYGYGYSSYRDTMSPDIIIPPPLWDVVLPLMCATGRCFLKTSITADPHPAVQWDGWGPVEIVY